MKKFIIFFLLLIATLPAYSQGFYYGGYYGRYYGGVVYGSRVIVRHRVIVEEPTYYVTNVRRYRNTCSCNCEKCYTEDYNEKQTCSHHTKVKPSPECGYTQVSSNYSVKPKTNEWFFFFKIDKFNLEVPEETEFAHLLSFAKENENATFYIDAYADEDTGTASHNLKLSENRANTIVNYLIKEGIASERLYVKCHGSTSQIYNNNRLNRCTIVRAVL